MMVGRHRIHPLEQRRASRYAVDFLTIGQNRSSDEIQLHVVNISAHGFMVRGESALDKGQRIAVRFPEVGLIEAHLAWTHEGRSGFQFERLLREYEFAALLASIQKGI